MKRTGKHPLLLVLWISLCGVLPFLLEVSAQVTRNSLSLKVPFWKVSRCLSQDQETVEGETRLPADPSSFFFFFWSTGI
jgi:hypothetical protein